MAPFAPIPALLWGCRASFVVSQSRSSAGPASRATIGVEIRMAKIHASDSELKTAHHQLSTASKWGTGTPSHLLLFYAAECGLKYAVLRENRFRTTLQLESLDHDLHSMVKRLRLSAATLAAPPALRLPRRRTETCSHPDAHQAWRYGVRINNEDEVAFVKWLNAVCDAVKEHL